MKQYTYYGVHPTHPADIDNTYSYLADFDIPVGSYVEMPFGYENNIFQGVVVSKGIYTKETAPYPVEKTKKILRVITEQEYEAGPKASWVTEIRELEKLIAEEDYDEVFEWAAGLYECRKYAKNPEMIRHVVRAYRFCADAGDARAALNLGSMYYNGNYVRQDYKKAAELYQIAADAGYVQAICDLGSCYYYGRHQAPDYEAAYRYFSLGAALDDNPICLYRLGDMHRKGLYVKRNQEIAEQLYFSALKACDQPRAENFCRADILLRLGTACLEGSPRLRNAERALEYLTRALTGFYDRRKTDPFVSDPIAQAKAGIRKAEKLLDRELIRSGPAPAPDAPPVKPRKPNRFLKSFRLHLRKSKKSY